MIRPPSVRPPAVAGTFYPAEPAALRRSIEASIADAVAPPPHAQAPVALVVPHAGYMYSGAIAASAYARLAPLRHSIRRVVLLGPSHRVYLRGCALTAADAWDTPLGPVAIDTDANATLARLPGVAIDDTPHAPEHSLEVQLPFLVASLDAFTLVPVVVGDAGIGEVAKVIDVALGMPDTLVLVSTDLSHYHRYADAVAIDARTAAAITARRPTDIDDTDACGARPLRGLLAVADARGLTVEQIDLRNSGDTAGDRSRVVGYASFALREEKPHAEH